MLGEPQHLLHLQLSFLKSGSASEHCTMSMAIHSLMLVCLRMHYIHRTELSGMDFDELDPVLVKRTRGREIMSKTDRNQPTW